MYHVLVITECQNTEDMAYQRLARQFGKSLQEKGFRVLFAMSRDSFNRSQFFGFDPKNTVKLPNTQESFLNRISELQHQHHFKSAGLFIHPSRPQYLPSPIKTRVPFLIEYLLSNVPMAHGHLVIQPLFHTSKQQELISGSVRFKGPKFWLGSPYHGLPPSPGNRVLIWLTRPIHKKEPAYPLIQAIRANYNVTLITDKDMAEQGKSQEPKPDQWPFSWTLTDAAPRCFDLASWGKPFIHFPLDDDQYTFSYMMDEAGMAAGLGVLDRFKPNELNDQVQAWSEPAYISRFLSKARKVVDGQGFRRIFPFLVERSILTGFGLGEEQ